MPVLGLDLPRALRRDNLTVMESVGGTIRPSLAVQARLSPFSPEAVRLIRQLYDDLATHTRFDGILFRDDAFLTDAEDFNPQAVRAAAAAGLTLPPAGTLTAEQASLWAKLKTARLSDLTAELLEAVRQQAPLVRSARSVYAPVLHHPESEAWLAQNYGDALRRYDEVVLLAHAEAEHVRRADAWLENLVRLAAAEPDGLARTVFSLQSYDRSRAQWVGGADLAARLDRLARDGATRLAYGPDDYAAGQPEAAALGRRMVAPPWEGGRW
jgi:biofilm PGA synthesis lipoprotein PgaB